MERTVQMDGARVPESDAFARHTFEIVGYADNGARVTFTVEAKDDYGALREAAKRAILNDVTATKVDA